MLNKFVQSSVFFILWLISLFGITLYFSEGNLAGLIWIFYSYLTFLIFQIWRFRQLNILRESNRIRVAKPVLSSWDRIEKIASTPGLILILFIALSFSDKYGLIVLLIYPSIFSLILWVMSIVYRDLYFGLILTNDRIIWHMNNMKIDSICSIILNNSGKLIINKSHSLDKATININKYDLAEIDSFLKILRERNIQITVENGPKKV